jgi:putative Mg2+ transporter-C (MgtC) family protein
MDFTSNEMILRLGLGAICGGAIGLERQINGRPAGFRTHMLVCVASVLLMELSMYYHHLSYMDPSYVRVDPGRIASGAITGIGFIGAGVIIKLGANVLGLTTAASLWMVSAIGFSIGAGLYLPATAAFALTIFSLFVLRLVERITPGLSFKAITIKSMSGVDEDAIRTVLKKHNASLYRTDYEVDNVEGTVTLYYTVSIRRLPTRSKALLRALVEDISALEKVNKVNLRT